MSSALREPAGRAMRPGVACLALIVILAACSPDTPESRIDETMRRVEDIRGLDSEHDVPYSFLTSDAAFADLLEELDEPEMVNELETEATLYHRLGLMEAGIDRVELVKESTKQSVLGFYDPEAKHMTIVDEDGEVSPDELMVLAHEHVHALQDQHYDLEARLGVFDDDADLALRALVEGEATIVMYIWAVKRLSPYDWTEIEEHGAVDIPTDYEPLRSIPPILWRPGEFPYVDGAAFVYEFWGPGGWDAVHEMWGDPPASTEQVLHPHRYPHDVPVAVNLPDVATAMGDGWSTTAELTMGELQTSVLLADGDDWDYGEDDDVFTFPQARNAEAAEGWGGDRLQMLDGPREGWVIVWQTTWDSEADALEFAAAANVVMADLEGRPLAMLGRDITTDRLAHPVLVLIADSDPTFQMVATALDLG
jgi:hypothetical protein